ncbi:MAG: peptidase S8 [Desulfobacteraceae bacterium]|nr:MAG: peptidase S8 [Desulfobacteraceae bacterium]
MLAAPNISNNSIIEAQELTSPAVLGGYVNLKGAGDQGQTSVDGDPSDFYSVALSAGEVVRLALPDDATARMRLFLYDETGTLVEESPDAAPSVALSVATAGRHYVEVRALSGAGSYRLMIGTPAALMTPAGFNPAAEFVPGEVLVRLKTAAAQQPGARSMSAFARDYGMQMLARPSGEWMRLRIADMPTTLDRLNIPTKSPGARGQGTGARANDPRQDTWRVVQGLRQQPDVAHAQPNFIRRPLFVPNDPLFPFQWHHELINLPQAWDLTTGHESVIVAVIDTGVLPGHPDLQGKLVSGYDFISDPVNAADGDGIDDDPTDPGDDPGASSFHGTHVAGIVAAAFDNGIGVAGAGGHTRIMPVRVLGRDGGTDADIARAVRWAAGLDTPNGDGTELPGASPRADIINMSLGGEGVLDQDVDVLALAVAAARDAGVIVIAAAGNNASSVPLYPAAYASVVAVGAVDAAGRRAAYSNFGFFIDVAAPGGVLNADLQPDGYADGVLSTLGSDAGGGVDYSYSYYQGTSMAAPHVAGVAALMKAARIGLTPDLTPDQFEAYLANHMITADLGSLDRDDFYGHGLIDAHRAVVAALDSPPPAVATVMPAALRLDAFEETARLDLRQAGSGTLTLTGVFVSGGAEWLMVVRTQGPGDFGQYTLSVDRTALPGGVHTGFISFVFSDQTLTVPVTIDVLPHAGASASTQYVTLLDENFLTVGQVAVAPSGGVYHFSFSDVPPGSYYLLSGSDLDDDFQLLDQGEAVGTYPTPASLISFTVSSDRTGLDFVTGFQQWPFFLPGESVAAAAVKR